MSARIKPPVVPGATGVEPNLNGRGWVAFVDGKLLPGWFKSRKTAQAALRKVVGDPNGNFWELKP